MGYHPKLKDGYSLKSSDLLKDITELYDYLQYANIPSTFCDECQRLLLTRDDIHEAFNLVKDKALSFKNGEFDEQHYSKFQETITKIISRPLKDHQQKAAYHLYLTQNGANFSVPGSGKTAVVLSVYEKLRTEGKVNTLFVVGPLASFGPWRSEFKAVLGRNPEYRILAGGSQEKRELNYFDTSQNKAELYLTSFQTLLSDSEKAKYLFNQSGIDVFYVIDEAHYIKRIDGQWASAVLSLGKLAQFRSVLTGTPMPKSYLDTFNLFDFLWPGGLALDDDSKIKIRNFENQDNELAAGELIKEKLSPLFYRVRKTELGLDEQIFQAPIKVEMGPYEHRIYRAIENRIRDYSKSEYIRNIEFVSALYRGRIIRLRQATSYIGLLESAIEDYSEDILSDNLDLKKIIKNYDLLETPSKIYKLLEIVQNLRKANKKVVIWSNFIGTLKLIKKHLLSNGFNCQMIYGGTPIEKESLTNNLTRERIRDEFVEPNSGLDILIANPAACSESISLHTGCQDAIYYDLSYNCAQYLQSLDRIHRVGGSELRPSNYYFLQYRNTLDQDIHSNVQRKKDRMFRVIEEDFAIYSMDMFEGDDDLDAYNRLFQPKTD